MDEYINYLDAYDQHLDEIMMEQVKEGILNPRPVFDSIHFRSIWGLDDDDCDLETPAYARRMAKKIV